VGHCRELLFSGLSSSGIILNLSFRAGLIARERKPRKNAYAVQSGAVAAIGCLLPVDPPRQFGLIWHYKAHVRIGRFTGITERPAIALPSPP
jgi:hypothetical protein